MRKQTKIAALVSAAALLAIGASMTSFAAGWNSLGNGDAEYLDSDGYRVTQEWKKYTDGKWYYLKDDGLMARNELVPYGDYLYCVNDDGSRVLGEWRYFDNTEGEEVNGITPGGFWYYFDASTGRAKTGGLHTIDSQKFRFTEEGRMITDWYTEDNETYYYFNNLVVESDHTYGAAANGWLKMEPRVDSTDEELDSDLVYYYFDNGKMVTGSKYIDKTWYYFDGDGILRESGWNKIEGDKATDSVSAPGNVAYSDANGAKLTGWQYLPDKNVDGNGKVDTSASYWFHLDKKGVRYYPGKFEAASVGEATGSFPGISGTAENQTVGLAKINGKFYLFDSQGRMLSGIYKITSPVTAEIGSNMTLAAGTYYFSDDDWVSGQGKNGAMATNSKHTVTNEYGDQTNYYFQKTGAAYEYTVVSNVYYGKGGVRVDAEDDYKVVEKAEQGDGKITVVTSGKTTADAVKGDMLVNTRGVAQRKKTIKNVGGYMTYIVGKLPTKSEVLTSGFEWYGTLKATAEAAATIPASTGKNDEARATAAQKQIDAVKKVIEDTTAPYSGYEIIATID